MAVIQRNAQVQAKLIEDLLEVNKLTSGTVRLEIGPLDVGAAVDAAIESLKPTADTKGVHLSVERDDVLPRISADGRRVQQILWNLLHNAVKFTRAGGSVDGRRSTVPRGACASVVNDTGQGIAPEFLPHVFDRFRQADPSTTRGAWGLGLGLSITKHLVELHGGSIEAASEGLEQGATFIVRLPVRHMGTLDDCSAAAGDGLGPRGRWPGVPRRSEGQGTALRLASGLATPPSTCIDSGAPVGARRSDAGGSALHFAPWKNSPSAADLTIRRRLGRIDRR